MLLTPDAFFLDPEFQGSLQSQIRQNVAGAILSGRIRIGDRLPSSRKLSQHLGISRITVTLAYQDLVADGYLDSRDRSGYFVAETAPQPELSASGAIQSKDTVNWSRFLQRTYSDTRLVPKIQNWRKYPYPFIYGQSDPTLFNHSSWRACAHQALGLRDIDSLISDMAAKDDPHLIDFIVRQTLPRRGINAKPEEILITIGAQNALWFVVQLLLSPERKAAFETPGYPGIRAILRQSGCRTHAVQVDKDGLPPGDLPPDIAAVFVTPSHHAPTTVTMPMGRRRELLDRAEADDFLIVEDDYEFEMSFLKPPSPALKSIDRHGRVIYVGSFSKSLFPGLRLGYLVGPEPLIREARALRSVQLRHPPGHIQRTTAYFLARGHYDTLVKRMRDTFAERRKVMAAAIEHHGLSPVHSSIFGGTSFWMRAPEHVDTEQLADILLGDGVIIEPGSPFFDPVDAPRNFYRLAYSSINRARIADGTALVAKRLAEM